MATMAYTMEELMWHYEQLQTAPDAYAKDPAIMEELRCGYSSKRCENIRTTKKGGGLHRFCEFHRRRANKNQWRVDNKRRMMRTQQSTGAAMISKVAPYSPKPTPRVVKKEEREEPMLPEPVEMKDEEEDESWLSDSDIAMLQQILFDEEEYERQGFLTMLHSDKEPVATSPTAVNDVTRFKQEWVV